MALRNKQQAEAPAAAGGFEDDEKEVAVATPAKAPTVAQQATADVAATTAVAQVGASALVPVAADDGPEDVIGSLKDKFDPVGYGAIERLKGSNGMVWDSQNRKLGVSIKLELLSWNYLYTLSPGSNAPDAKELVRYSLDGKTIQDTGESVADYLQNLREVEKYPNAACKEYVSLVGILVEAEDSKCPHIGNVVEVSLSPVAAKKFATGHRLQVTVKRRRKLISAVDAANVVVRAEVATNKKNETYTFLNVSDK